ncbi:hypothetical protein PR202_ga29332 [Eleusine coracana subsp. coracana]|uniref:Uncharacterized protein n=1 Tax=Eleusine coracana subsp. coracana TaxID=191504 RepID=A0AAV5DLV7_ELECO|nr:hypothetical protein PR202_ga29332 [Eleusine coracana subsp. coracana]
MTEIVKELDHLWLIEEIAAKQRSRDRKIKEGDRNTAYFHALANQRRRKKFISKLEGPNGMVNSTADIMNVAVDFYKNLFGFEPTMNLNLADDF